jgi:hypothetical protein
MRKVVAYEGKPMHDGQMINSGALSAGSDRLPVTISFKHDNVIGWATDFQRDDETGEISFEIGVLSGYEMIFDDDETPMSATIYANNVEGVVGERGFMKTVDKAVIREVSFVPDAVFPWQPSQDKQVS